MSVRIYVKRDEESSVGRGAVLSAAHFRPEMAAIIYEAARATELQFPEATELWITEGWRRIREARDLHRERRAFDFTVRTFGDERLTRDEYELVAYTMRNRLGPDVQVIVHGESTSGIHLHAELDPQ